MTSAWYYVEKKQKIGPINENEIKTLIHERKLNESTLVWTKGQKDWKKIKEIDILFSFLNETQKINTISLNIDDEKIWFLKQDKIDKIFGPFSLNMLKLLHEDERLDNDCLLFSLKDKQWFPLQNLQYFQRLYGKITDEKKWQEKIDKLGLPETIFVQQENTFYSGLVENKKDDIWDILLNKFEGKNGDRIFLKSDKYQMQAIINDISNSGHKIKIKINK